MSMQYCMKCMSKQFPGVSVCPHCGTPYRQSVHKANALKPGHILNGKYLVGAVLGEGGFGITYIGLDLLLEKKVAIKEYFPMSTGMVRRYNASAVVWNSEVRQKNGQSASLDSFLQEARKLAKVDSIPCVVNVRDLFSQNNTAYIVMDYIEGENLAQKLQREGPMPFDQCVSMLTPIIQALEQVHRLGIIHRDISPDNIMIQPHGRLMLLDLGAAKEIDIQKKDGSIQSSRLVAKEGFSPLEQYSSNGRIGTWTDVYSMSATIYYCCTGKLPPRATERAGTDCLVCIPPLREKEFAVLKRGMALNGKDRIQTMGELLELLQALNEAPQTGGNATKIGAENVPSGHQKKPHSIPSPLSSLANRPMTVAAVLFGVEATVFLCMVYILETIDYVLGQRFVKIVQVLWTNLGQFQVPDGIVDSREHRPIPLDRGWRETVALLQIQHIVCIITEAFYLVDFVACLNGFLKFESCRHRLPFQLLFTHVGTGWFPYDPLANLLPLPIQTAGNIQSVVQ